MLVVNTKETKVIVDVMIEWFNCKDSRDKYLSTKYNDKEAVNGAKYTYKTVATRTLENLLQGSFSIDVF